MAFDMTNNRKIATPMAAAVEIRFRPGRKFVTGER